MKQDTQFRKKQLKMEELQAFVLFLNEGIKAAERMFPQHMPFVEANKNKAYSEVKQQLLVPQHAV